MTVFVSDVRNDEFGRAICCYVYEKLPCEILQHCATAVPDRLSRISLGYPFNAISLITLEENGGAGRNRTDDLYNAIVALSQLSYGPKTVFVVAGLGASTCGRREHNYPATQRKRNLTPGDTGVKKISACD